MPRFKSRNNIFGKSCFLAVTDELDESVCMFNIDSEVVIDASNAMKQKLYRQ
ncbi:hypothetical protein ACRU1U_12880 [Providencia stuartii]|uniref:hypothetical protein n=1 Tax=Providencia stuartii TaxID=588 RepID=UPI003D7FFF7D